MDRGVWWATVHGAAKSQTQLKQLSTKALSLLTVMPETNYLMFLCLKNWRLSGSQGSY